MVDWSLGAGQRWRRCVDSLFVRVFFSHVVGSGPSGGPQGPALGYGSPQSARPGQAETEPAETRDQQPQDETGFEGPGRYSPIPKLVGDYQLVRRLTGGSMAELYVARKVSQFGFVHRAVIKQVKRSRPDFRQLQRMLLDEARATACFDHPNLVKIFDVGETEQGLYLALEYVDGTDLRRVNQKLRSRKEALPFELACHIAAEVLRGVHHAHTARGPDGKPLEIVHRDVNPSNVLVSTSGHVKLADFGVVRMRERIQPKTEPGLVKGKYAYLAPEYIAGEPCNVQTDVYAAGIMLFELLSGRECFTGASAYEVMWKIVNKGVPMYRLQREGVPEDLQRLVARSTSMVPERRYASAQDMANALEAWLMRSQKHATPWVLSVFFHRHDLFSKPLDSAMPPLSGHSAAPTSRPDAPVNRENSADRPLFQSARDVVDDSLTPAPEIAGAPMLDIDPVADHRIFPPSSPTTPPPLPGFDVATGSKPSPKSSPGSPIMSSGGSQIGSGPPIAEARPRAPTETRPPERVTSPLPTEPAMQPPWTGAPKEPIGGRPMPPAGGLDHEPPTLPPSGFGTAHGGGVNVSDLSDPIPPGTSIPPGQPIRSGKLEDHPATDILERINADGSSGIIEFRCGLIWKRVLITDGKPTGVTSNMGMELIGEHLVKARIVTRDDLERALQDSERLQKPLTVCLLDQKALSRETLEIELGRNLGARLQEVLEWRWGTYEFTQQPMAPVEILPRLDLADLLARARANREKQDARPDEAAPTSSGPVEQQSADQAEGSASGRPFDREEHRQGPGRSTVAQPKSLACPGRPEPLACRPHG